MNENKEEMMITVPYDDFIEGIQALQTIITIRNILKESGGYASSDIEAILGIHKKPKCTTGEKEQKEDAKEDARED